MTAGALTVFLSYLTKFFKPVKDLASMTNSIAQAAVGVDRVRAILDADNVIPESPDARVLPESRSRRDPFRPGEVRLRSGCPGASKASLSISSRASWLGSSAQPEVASPPSSA